MTILIQALPYFFLQLSETPALPLGLNPTNTYDSAQFWSRGEIHTTLPIHTNKINYMALVFFSFIKFLICFLRFSFKILDFSVKSWLYFGHWKSVKVTWERWEFQSRFSICLQDPRHGWALPLVLLKRILLSADLFYRLCA